MFQQLRREAIAECQKRSEIKQNELETIKNLCETVVTTVLFSRGIIEKRDVEEKTIEGVQFAHLKSNTNDKFTLQLKDRMDGIKSGIESKLIKAFALKIRSADGSALERWEINLEYIEDDLSLTLGLQSDNSTVIREQSSDMMKVIMQKCKEFKQLPPKKIVELKVAFLEGTPLDFQIPNFNDCDKKEFYEVDFEERPKAMHFGGVETNKTGMAVTCKTTRVEGVGDKVMNEGIFSQLNN